jgi:hypothetical protein
MMPVRTALRVCQMRRAVERVFPAIEPSFPLLQEHAARHRRATRQQLANQRLAGNQEGETEV